MAQLKLLAVLLLAVILTEVHGRSIDNHLLGSSDSNRKSHIHHVAITRRLWINPFGKDQFVGSGALISNRWLITSATVASQIKSRWYTAKVKAGLERMESDPLQSMEVEKVVIHEFYKKETDNDIALVKVKSPGFVLNDYVGVVTVADTEPPQDGQVIVTGWYVAGKEKKPLQELKLGLKERKACGQALDDEKLVDQTLFCVENSAVAAVCQNDYGSPAIIEEGREVLVGIFTMAPRPASGELCSAKPAVFTNVGYYNTWIGNNLS